MIENIGLGFVQTYSYLAKLVGNKYLFAAIVFVAYYMIYRLILKGIKFLIAKATSKTKTDIDDKILNRAESPISFIIFVLGLYLIIFPLEIVVQETLNKITFSLIVVSFAYILITAIDIILYMWGEKWAKRTKSTLDDALIPLFRIINKIVFILGAFIIIISEWGVDISALLAGVGIAGLALGLALQGSLSNIFGGISLILDKAIRVGDIIELSDQVSGTVIDVGIRSTRVRTWDNELVIVPNGELANNVIRNKKLPNLKSRMEINFGVEYGSDPEKVRKTVKKAMVKIDKIIDDPEPIVVFKEMGDFALHFTAYCWVKDISERFMTRDVVVTKIYQALNKEGIGIPFPTNTVFIKKTKRKKTK